MTSFDKISIHKHTNQRSFRNHQNPPQRKHTWKRIYNSTHQNNWNHNEPKLLPGIEEITEGQAHTNTRKLYRDISTGTAVFFNRKRVNVCEHTTKTASLESLRKVPPRDCERDVIFVFQYFPFHVVYFNYYLLYQEENPNSNMHLIRIYNKHNLIGHLPWRHIFWK